MAPLQLNDTRFSTIKNKNSLQGRKSKEGAIKKYNFGLVTDTFYITRRLFSDC